MTDPDPHPDSLPDADNDTRSDIERIVQSRSDEADRAGGGATTSPGSAPGDFDGNSGTGGVTKNQDLTQQ